MALWRHFCSHFGRDFRPLSSFEPEDKCTSSVRIRGGPVCGGGTGFGK